MRIKLTLSYDGTDFCGWQRQKNGVSVQEVLESAIEKLTGKFSAVTGSGRTDAGVHAEGQTAHFDTESSVPPEKFAYALNTLLPGGVKISESEKVADGFSARRSVKSKTYRYSVYNSNIEKPLKERYYGRVWGNLDLNKMERTAKFFVGEHDFKAFSASGNSTLTTVRTVNDVKIEKVGEDYFFFITGNGFLYNMVRIMVGTLVAVGRGDIPEENVEKMLNTGDRTLGGDTLPAKGLCLIKVDY